MSSGNKLVIDAVAEFAEAGNYWVVIKENTLYLVNRNQDSSTIVEEYRIPQLLSLRATLPNPIRRLRAEWTQNVPYANVLRLETQTQEAIVSVNPYGQDLDLQPMSQVETEVEDYLKAYYEIVKRPTVSAEIQGILAHEIGDRVSVYDYQQELKAVITLSSISYNFDNETTTLSGASVLTHVQDV